LAIKPATVRIRVVKIFSAKRHLSSCPADAETPARLLAVSISAPIYETKMARANLSARPRCGKYQCSGNWAVKTASYRLKEEIAFLAAVFFLLLMALAVLPIVRF
jgi:hypothetical protein